MKAIRFNLHQDFANYRRFYDFQQSQSYPLPPLSTVAGMLHTLANLKGYHPMKLFVTGSAAGTTQDYRTQYEFANTVTKLDSKSKQKDTWARYQFMKNQTAFATGPKPVQMLVDVNLTIYVQLQSQEDFNAILAGLQNPIVYPALGRHEDSADITDIQVIDLQTVKLNHEYKSNKYLSTYMPIEYARKHHIKLESGTKYNIHHHFGYEKVNKNVTRRSWTDVNMMYTSQYHVNPGNEIVMDTQSNQLVALI